MQEIARENGIPFLQVPSGYQPRAATGYLSLPIIVVLSRLGLMKEMGDWKEVLSAVSRVKERCTMGIPSAENPAKELARSLYGRVPIVYGTTDNTDLVAMRFKTQINENAKQPAYWNAFSECYCKSVQRVSTSCERVLYA